MQLDCLGIATGKTECSRCFKCPASTSEIAETLAKHLAALYHGTMACIATHQYRSVIIQACFKSK